MREKNSRRTQLSGPCSLCEFYLQELDQVFTVNIRKNPLRLPAEGRERNHVKDLRALVALSQACLQGKPVNRTPACWVIGAPLTRGRGIPNSSPLNPSCPTKGAGKH